MMRPRLGLFDEQFAQQTRHVVVDELAAVVGMKAANREGELLQQGFQHRHQPQFGDLRGGGHNFPLRHLVDGVDVIQPFASILIALMHGVDAEITRASRAAGACAARRWESAWAVWVGSWCFVCDKPPNCAAGTGGPPRSPPDAGRQPGCIGCIRAPGCAGSPVRSSSHALGRRRPTGPHPPPCSAWRTWSVDRPPLAPAAWRRPRSAASPGRGSDPSSGPGNAAPNPCPAVSVRPTQVSFGRRPNERG